VFIRFVGNEIDEDSRLSLGLFQAAYDLLEDGAITEYECAALNQLFKWFDENLKVPFDYRLRPRSKAERSFCWFRSTARAHLARAWEMVLILEARDIFITHVRCREVGHILYEDDVQVLAYPGVKLRKKLGR
jgi:hypothetical protein